MAQNWEYDGIDLTTYAYTIRWLGAPLSVPARRADNLVVPQKRGRFYVPKMHDQRVVPLAMWVKDVDPNTGAASSEAQLLANLDTLRALFARDGQHTLKYQYGSSVRKATAEVVNQIEFEPKSLKVYWFVVEFLLADPLWYAESLTTVGPTKITMPSQNITVTNGGTYVSDKAIYTLAGPLVNPKLTIGSTWVQYTGSVGSGQSLVLTCETWTALLAAVDVSGNITHDGALSWLPIPVGVNTLNVASSGYTGTSAVTVEFYPPYI